MLFRSESRSARLSQGASLTFSLQYLTSRAVRNSPSVQCVLAQALRSIANPACIRSHVNAIYNCLHANAPRWTPRVIECLQAIMNSKTLKDPNSGGRAMGFDPDGFLQVFSPLGQMLYE